MSAARTGAAQRGASNTDTEAMRTTGEYLLPRRARFGEQRLVPRRSGMAERWLYRAMGIADPAHYLHFRYLQAALRSLGHFHPRQILDAGCGRGDHSLYLARRYPSAEVVGIDIDEHLITRNRDAARELKLKNVRFEVGDLSRIDRTENFDLVVSIDVLEHISNQADALAALARALEPGGVAFYHIPTVRERPVPFSGRLDDFHAWAAEEHIADDHTAESFIDAVGESGLRVLRGTPTFGFYTGEMATSLFALPYRNTPLNRVLQGLLAPVCRVLTLADGLGREQPHYAVAVLSTKPT